MQFSQVRLDRMRNVMAGFVERNEMPGLVSLVSRRGETHVDVFGHHEFERRASLQRDSIFRIASITKPVTAVAAMILIEECKLRLDESIDAWLPELANRRVLKRIDAELDDTVPAVRAITVRDLLTFRMGFGSLMAPPDTYPIQRAIREYKLGGDGPPKPLLAPSTDEWLQRLGSLPLICQPGERWLYHTGADVLGVLIERVTQRSLETFMRERIFEPLGMNDTGFHVPALQAHRLPTSYTGSLALFDAGDEKSDWSKPPPMQSGGGGLVSTADDCLAFFQMLLDKGTGSRVRILSRASVELMTSDQLLPSHRAGAEIFFKGDSESWGFGMSVQLKRNDIWATPGRFGWSGGLGTCAYADPQEQLVRVLLTQRMMDSPVAPKVFNDFWTSVYQALEDGS